MSKRWVLCASALALVTVMALSAFAAAGEMALRPQDDLYAAVNAEWLSVAEIPANKFMVGGFDDLGEQVEQLLMTDFAAMTDETAAQFEALPEFLQLYAMAADYEARDEQGAQPLAPYLAEIDGLSSLAELSASLPSFILRQIPALLSCGVTADMGNARQYALYLSGPSLFLPDVSYYNTPTGDALLQVFGQSLGTLLQLCGYDNEDAARIVEQAMTFDALVMPYMPSSEEMSDYTKLYNPMALADFAACSSALDLAGLVEALVPAVPERVVVLHPAYFTALDQVVNEENFPLIKSWITACTVYASAPMLSQDMEAAAAAYRMTMTGQAEMDEPQKRAYRLAYAVFDGPVGNYYGRTYFGEEAKRDVTAMVEQMLQIFGRRLQANEWLSPETVQAAQRKLERMALQIGYPDKLRPEYTLIKVTPSREGGTLMGNMMALSRIAMEANLAKCGQETDLSYWDAGAATVNAFYQPMANAITFPAAILQAPFYSLDQSDSRNLGGIGAVIAHEITHAFDSNGAKFDEYGSLNNWWTEEDYAAFDERTQAMVALFDGIPFTDGAVNGKLTVSENIADAGGLSCALEICQSLADPDPCAFFENWATIWRIKVMPQFEQLLLAIDVHAPNELRANMQARNQDAFYTAFSVEEDDGMYLAPEERVGIW
ncbi:MAG: M13 family metallopeptidase [Clostridia bacterium]|nr:M13 family metallopeptidase [Clostridia bacterium]